MSTGITAWLGKTSAPAHLYELLGRPLLDPDRDGLVRALRAANRELLDYQSHPDRATAAKALALLTELGRVRGILEDPARLAAHDAEILESFRRAGAAAGVVGPGAVESAIPAWLGLFYGLNADDAERVAGLLVDLPFATPIADPPGAQPDRGRPSANTIRDGSGERPRLKAFPVRPPDPRPRY